MNDATDEETINFNGYLKSNDDAMKWYLENKEIYDNKVTEIS